MGEDAGSTRYIPERTLFDMESVDVFSVDLNCNLNI